MRVEKAVLRVRKSWHPTSNRIILIKLLKTRLPSLTKPPELTRYLSCPVLSYLNILTSQMISPLFSLMKLHFSKTCQAIPCIEYIFLNVFKAWLWYGLSKYFFRKNECLTFLRIPFLCNWYHLLLGSFVLLKGFHNWYYCLGKAWWMDLDLGDLSARQLSVALYSHSGDKHLWVKVNQTIVKTSHVS